MSAPDPEGPDTDEAWLPPDSFGADDAFGDPFDDQTAIQDSLSTGGFFGDRFRVEGALGTGGMGKVLEATDLTNGARVALKVLHRERAADPETLARFEREAMVLASLGHPAIVRIHALGRAPNGTPWLALELVRGTTLKEHIGRGPMDAFAIIPLVNTLADALAAAHAAGVVHRDLSPSNVLLTGAEPPLKILDFGLSSIAGKKQLTATGSILGTPRYMAPEQIRSAKDAGPRVDVYAMGVLVFEMLTGRSPYPADDMGQLLGCVIEGRRVKLTALRPDLPPALESVIERAMHVDPTQRWQTMGELAEAYSRALGTSSGRSQLALDPASTSDTDLGASIPMTRLDLGSSPGPPPAPPVAPRAPDEVVRRARARTPTPMDMGRASYPADVPRDFTRPSRPTPLPVTSVLPAPRRRSAGLALFLVAAIVVAAVAAALAVALRIYGS